MSDRQLTARVSSLRGRLREAPLSSQLGSVHQVRGLVIEANGPNLAIGDLCHIETRDGTDGVMAEVVGFHDHRMLIMPLGEMNRIAPGSIVAAANHDVAIPTPASAMGRIIDGLGNPIDGKGPLNYNYGVSVRTTPPDPLTRKSITDTFSTGIRAIDLFAPVGRGQRLGIFAGSGVGKSTLLGMFVRGSEADVNVIALIGERGREVREFVENTLGPEEMARSVIIVSTSDQPAMLRLRAAFLATTIAESYRDLGKNVLFMMDSVTRFAMAQREIGLSVGEPPASRGYPPSVFSLLPRLMERTGNSADGTITAFYTVLVEGDDMNEPIADSVRGILDGHVVLSRAIATANIYPAVDVLESISRLNTQICTEDELDLIARARGFLATYRQNEDLINIGAYANNSNATIDEAIDKRRRIVELLRQNHLDVTHRKEGFEKLKEVLS
ncbi:MAG: FliI/YscN family ATPase [Verrucomicrobia bacterium]|nr:FliI/YscN family ATPase [Verrucomicrobiota bacterium]